MSDELYKKYRPTKFSEVVGQDQALRLLSDFGKRKSVPQTLLFTGPSGTGKTTLARILRDKLGCVGSAYQELNAAKTRGIDTIRDIEQRMSAGPLSGKCRIWILDESHRLTGDAQSALLKMLEDTPPSVYFMLCTTDPQKLLNTIRTRATEIKLSAVSDKAMVGLLQRIIEAEDLHVSDDVVDKIVDLSDGSPRMALVYLNKLVGKEGDEEQLKALESGDIKRHSDELFGLLLNSSTTWTQVSAVLSGIDGLNEQAEGIRCRLLHAMGTMIMKYPKKAPRCMLIYNEMAMNFYDTGRAGLVAACYQIVSG